MDAPLSIEAQIAGTVWRVEAAVADQVSAGDVLLILESMKMEVPVEAPRDGRVAELRVDEGDAVEEGTVLAVLA